LIWVDLLELDTISGDYAQRDDREQCPTQMSDSESKNEDTKPGTFAWNELVTSDPAGSESLLLPALRLENSKPSGNG